MKKESEADKMKNASRAQVALIAFVLFVLGVGGLYALSNKLIQASKSQEAVSAPNNKIFSISEVYGNTKRVSSTLYRDTLIFKVTNAGSSAVALKGVSAFGRYNNLWYGDSQQYDTIGHIYVSPGACAAGTNAAKGCSITLQPGAWTYVQTLVMDGNTLLDGDLCNQQLQYEPPSVNSVRASASAPVVLYYALSPAPNPVETDSVSISQFSYTANAKCMDYWVCEIDAQCIEKYGDIAPDCISGGCGLILG